MQKILKTTIFLLLFFYLQAEASLVAEYRLDECRWDGTSGEVKDNIGSHDGTAFYNAQISSGQINNGGYFSNDGSYNSFVRLNGALENVTENSWTFSSWVKIDSRYTDKWRPILFVPDSDNDRYGFMSLWFNNDDKRVEIWVLSGSSVAVDYDLNDGNTHALSLTMDGNTLKLYIDSEEKLTANYNYGNKTFATSKNFYIGIGRNDAAYTSYTYIDEVKIYDTPLSAADISTIYTNESAHKNYDGSSRATIDCITPFLHAEYRFDACSWDGTSGEVKDRNDTYNGTAHDTLPSTQARINHSADFSADSTSDYISLDHDAINGLGNFTISVWINTSPSSNYQTIISGAHAGGSAEDANELLLWLTDADKLEFWIKGERSDAYSIPNIEDNRWHHIVWTRDGSRNIIYIDGDKKIDINDFSTDTLSIDSGGLILGQDQDSVGGGFEQNQNFLGYMDELKIFNTFLTDNEVQAIYDKEKQGNSYDGSSRTIPACSLIAEYRFDACSWDGSDGEVTDQTGDFDATDINGTTLTDGKINNAAHFDGTDDYIDLPDIDTDFSNGITISVWANFETTGSFQKIIELAHAKAQNVIGFTRNSDTSKLTFEIVNGDNYAGITTDDDVIDGNLHHYVATLQADGTAKIYVDGVEKVSGTFDFMPANVIRGVNYIAKSTWEGDGDDYFGGIIDELKIFDIALTAGQVQDIYNNESAHHNYDGSHRMAVDCTTPQLLAEYRFDECKYTGATGEVKDSVGGHDGTITGDANLSKDEKKIGHALYLDGGAVDIDNLAVATDPYRKNTVMFWMYWDGNDNMVPFSWQYYCLWFNNGNFGINAKNSAIYGVSSNGLAYGWHHIAAVFTNNDLESNRLYIDGNLQSSTLRQGDIANDDSTVATSNAYIGSWSDHGYVFKGYLDELKIYKGELNATTIADIYDTERNLVRTITCAQAIFNAVDRANGCFHWDNNITTKIAGADIDLTILAADENDGNSSLADANITKIELLSFSDSACSTLYATTELWSGNEAVDSNGCFTPASFIHDRAIKCAKIRITGIFEGNSVEANSSDTFSIRPDKFVLQNLPTGKLTAEESYTFRAVAVNSNGTTTTPDYNQTLTPTSKKYFRDDTDGSAMDGTFAPTDAFTFSDGTTADTTLSFDNVGKIGLELNDTAWAQVDSDDTPLAQRTIYLEQNLTFIPDRFAITFDATPTMDNHGRSFTYYANDLANMSADLKSLSFKVTALGKNGATTTNYHDDPKYYANDVDFSLGLSLEHNPILSNDINETNTIKNIHFDHGVATLSYADLAFNFGRERNVTKEPLFVDGAQSDLNITIIDSVDHEVNGTKAQHFDGNATFYYGRIRTKELRTADTPVQHSLSFLIYSSTALSGFEQYTQNWYINQADSVSDWIATTPRASRALSSATIATLSITNESATASGLKKFDITNSDSDHSQKAFFHLDIPRWLWYSRYEDYSFESGSSCATHPCFTYIFDAAAEDHGISSGKFKGVAFDHNFTSAPKRKAVKLLR